MQLAASLLHAEVSTTHTAVIGTPLSSLTCHSPISHTDATTPAHCTSTEQHSLLSHI